MLVIKSLHIIFMVTWFAGLFYLPRLFVYHAMSTDTISQARFKVMERKLFYGIMTPGGLLTIILGVWLWLGYGFSGKWIHYKLSCVLGLLIYHALCLKYLLDFKHDRNQKSHVFFRVFNEIPVFFLVVIVFLVILKPM